MKTDMNINLLCVTKDEGRDIMNKVYGRECKLHMNEIMLAKKVQMLGYYWSKVGADCYAYERRCHKCHVYANLQHQPPSFLSMLTSPWPFSV